MPRWSRGVTIEQPSPGTQFFTAGSQKESLLTGDRPLLEEHPDTFGPFRVRAELGAGRFGPVYVGRDPSNARVVIRTFELPSSWRGSAERTEILDSFRALCEASLNHPSIARHLAFGIEGDIPYLTSAYLPGTAMDVSIQKDGARPLDDVLTRVTDIAAAIDLAATAGVYHGMIEPDDVFFDGDATAVTSFGLAQALLRAGVPVEGRSPYASPRRQAGALPTYADDVYSLAAIALELVIGKSSVGSQDPSVALRQAQGLPERRRVPRPAPHETRLFTTIPGIDAGILRAVFAAAFSEEPGERPATGSEFVASFKEAIVDRFGTDEPSSSDVNAVGVFSSEDEWKIAPPRSSAQRAGSAPTPIDLPLRQQRAESEMALTLAETFIRDSPVAEVRPPGVGLAADVAAAPRGGRVLGIAAGVLLGLVAGFAGGVAVGQRFAPAAQESAAREAQTAQPDSTESRAPAHVTQIAVPNPAPPVESREPVADAGPPVLPASPVVPVPDPVQPVPPSGRVLVRSTPAGALVTVDGQSRGVTPLALRDLALSDHMIEVTHAGYDSRQQRVPLTAARPSRSIDFDLRPAATADQALAPADAPGALQVFSRPVGAEVFLDDNLIGTTPLLVSTVSPGPHRVRLQLPGYQTWSTSVQIEPKARFRIAASLEQ